MPKTVAKKTAVKKVAAPAKKSASRARATSTSTKGSGTSKTATAKKTSTSKAAKSSGTTTKKSATASKGSGKSTTKKSNLPVREVNPETGFVKGSDQDKIASAFLKGAETRQDIIDSLRKNLSDLTRNGTPKPVSNLVSSVFNKMISQGYRLESQYRLLPPTPASKRKAARAAK